MLEYKNSKTNSLLRIPNEQSIADIDDYAYLIKMMIYQDKKIIKNEIQKLANCLVQIRK